MSDNHMIKDDADRPRQKPLSAEHKAKMAAGRAAAREKRIEQARRLLGIEAPYGNAPGLKAALAGQQKEDAAKIEKLSPVVRHSESTKDIFAGLTARDCCDACGPKCVISGDVCVHPFKGGLQAVHYMKQDVLRRYNEAKNKLAHDALEKKYVER